MRISALILRLAFALAVLAPVAGHAETRMFIVANQADGYGIDRCLANGEPCGQVAARTYCQAQQFADAARFIKVSADDITGSVPSGGNGCQGARCSAFVAITCQR